MCMMLRVQDWTTHSLGQKILDITFPSRIKLFLKILQRAFSVFLQLHLNLLFHAESCSVDRSHCDASPRLRHTVESPVPTCNVIKILADNFTECKCQALDQCLRATSLLGDGQARRKRLSQLVVAVLSNYTGALMMPAECDDRPLCPNQMRHRPSLKSGQEQARERGKGEIGDVDVFCSNREAFSFSPFLQS